MHQIKLSNSEQFNFFILAVIKKNCLNTKIFKVFLISYCTFLYKISTSAIAYFLSSNVTYTGIMAVEYGDLPSQVQITPWSMPRSLEDK